MRITPKIRDIPTETRNRNIPTLSPLITCTAMRGPFVIQGNRPVMKSTVGRRGDGSGPPVATPARMRFLLLLFRRRGGAELCDLVAALDDLLAVDLLDVGDDRLAFLVH